MNKKTSLFVLLCIINTVIYIDKKKRGLVIIREKKGNE